MYKFNELLILIIILIVLIKVLPSNTEEFKVDSQNFPYTNAHDVADYLDYNEDEMTGMYQHPMS